MRTSYILDEKLNRIENYTKITNKKFWKAFEKEFHSQTIRKKNSLLMTATSNIVSSLGYATKKDFMDTIDTTIGKNIYLGNENEKTKISCLHEHHHVFNKISVKYIYSKNYRLQVEIPAYFASFVINYFCTTGVLPGEVDILKIIKRNTKLYGFTESNINYASSYIDCSLNLLKSDFTTNDLFIKKATDLICSLE